MTANEYPPPPLPKPPLPFVIEAVKVVEDSGDYEHPHGSKRRQLVITFLRDTRMPIEDCYDTLRGIAELHDWDPLGEGYLGNASTAGVGLVRQWATFRAKRPKQLSAGAKP